MPQTQLTTYKRRELSVYIEPSNKEDKRRWCGGLVIHPKEPSANLHTHAIPAPSSLKSSTIVALKDAASKCPSRTPQLVI